MPPRIRGRCKQSYNYKLVDNQAVVTDLACSLTPIWRPGAGGTLTTNECLQDFVAFGDVAAEHVDAAFVTGFDARGGGAEAAVVGRAGELERWWVSHGDAGKHHVCTVWRPRGGRGWHPRGNQLC